MFSSFRCGGIPRTITVITGHQDNDGLSPPLPQLERIYKRQYKAAASDCINSAYRAHHEGRFMDAIDDCKTAMDYAQLAIGFGSKKQAQILGLIAERKIHFLECHPPRSLDMRTYSTSMVDEYFSAHRMES